MRYFPEIVKVVDHARLIDSESYEQSYWRPGGGPLPAGYYIVSWSDEVCQPRYDERASFTGPFRSRAHAWMALDQQLEVAGEYFNRELEYRIKTFTTLFEPIMIIFVGVVVGFVAIALVSAMYGVLGGVKDQGV